jgi:hypothetical protein
MNPKSNCASPGWLDASGVPYLARAFRLALHPTKLTVALLGLIATLIWGGFLDAMWVRADAGVPADAIRSYIHGQQIDLGHEEGAGDMGPFRAWRLHERDCAVGLLASAVPASSWLEGSPVGSYLSHHEGYGPVGQLADMGYGVAWLVVQHPGFALLFGVGLLLIWSACGGGICRAAAVQFARDDRLTIPQAMAFVRPKLIGGFFFAPLLPLILALLIVLMLLFGGVVLRIPVFGDVVAGLLFFAAIAGGFIVALVGLGWLLGGSLFWPTVATEGSDAFDALSRAGNYVFVRPFKTIWYGIVAAIFGGIAWLFLHMLTFLALKIVRIFVGAGSEVFGLWPRAEHADKLEMVWAFGGIDQLHAFPPSGTLHGYEWIAAVLIGIQVLLVVGLLWSFVVSYYFSASTITYFLLRRDVDHTAMDDVCIEDADQDTLSPPDLGEAAGGSPDREPMGGHQDHAAAAGQSAAAAAGAAADTTPAADIGPMDAPSDSAEDESTTSPDTSEDENK